MWEYIAVKIVVAVYAPGAMTRLTDGMRERTLTRTSNA